MPVCNYSGSLAASGSSDWFRMSEPFNVVASGTWAGSWALEALADGETTAANCLMPDGEPNAFSGPGMIAVPNIFGDGVQYRITFTRSSGTLGWRIIR